MKSSIFHFIGLVSALTLMVLIVILLPGALQGDFSLVHEFFKKNPGSEPFVIFIMPVILLGGSAWIWRAVLDWRRR